jgi:hypothetical protein
MSKTGEQGKVPPPLLDEDGNPIAVEDGSNTETSTSTVKGLMKQLEKLNAKVKRLKAKGKKGKNIPPQAKMMTPHLKRKSPTKGRRKGKSTISPIIMLCLLTMITCLALPFILSYPLAKLHILIGQIIINGSIA